WDLAKLEDRVKREAQEKQKKEFDDLIKKLEDKKINGVEFECKGEWLTKGSKLRVTSVPQPTEVSKKRIRDDGRGGDRRTRCCSRRRPPCWFLGLQVPSGGGRC